MAKYKVGDICKVTKNLLSPKCIGHLVEIVDIASESEGHILYSIKEKESSLYGYASENCLELAE